MKNKMIKDKNIFECIVKDSVIWLPNYVFWGPPSHGHQRRSLIFKKNFPEKQVNIATKKSWEKMKNNRCSQRQIYRYNPEIDYLEKLEKDKFFTNSYGYPVYLGQKLILDDVIYTIDNLEVIKFAGLIASYTIDGLAKKTNVSTSVWDEENKFWRRKNESKD